MSKLLEFIKANPVIVGMIVGLLGLSGILLQRYGSACRQQGAAEQRVEVEASSRAFTERARTVDSSVLTQYEAAKLAVDPFSVTNMINAYGTTIASENKAQRHDPNRKGTSPDRIGRLYDGLCSTYDACPNDSNSSSTATPSPVSDRKPAR